MIKYVSTPIMDGLTVDVYRSSDGTLVVAISGPDEADTLGKGEPDIRIWLNAALIYAHGAVGDDLTHGGQIASHDVKKAVIG